ncbi:hypothetical protein ACQP1G_22580 [Nocardia sp. CA-107356]|uniref:hypothetical protein n=1 Tax=Nocardia sp. CA-107356 TaxID=3239972 RepID=UPI003D939DDF
MDSGLPHRGAPDDRRHDSMSELDEAATQRDLHTGIAAELAVAGFEAAEEIGRGRFGVVYRYYEYPLEGHVAVKVLMSEVRGDEREQFVWKQRALGQLTGLTRFLADGGPQIAEITVASG